MKYTTVASPRWANADKTAINAVVTFEGFEPMPYTASQIDPEAHGREIFTRAKAKEFGTVAPYVAPLAPVPASVTPLQARKALRQAGIYPAVQAYISSLPEESQDEWEYCIAVERSNPLIAGAADLLGLNDAAIDDLFKLAATL